MSIPKIRMVVLFEESRPEIEIQVTASITDQEELLIKGIDSGSLVKQLQGDLDYEYFLTVDKVNKILLIQKLNSRNIQIHGDADLLRWLSENHSGNRAFSSVQAFLKAEEVEFKTFFWS